MSPSEFSPEPHRGSDFGPEQERILRSEEQRLLGDEDRQLMHEDDRGLPSARAEGQCANHPEEAATAACNECGRQLCARCVFASGGGHAFCKQCMDSTRLIDAEPRIIGAVTQDHDTREGMPPRLVLLVLFAVLGLVAIAMAAILALGALL